MIIDVWVGGCVQSLSRVWLYATPWTAPLSTRFPRQEYWIGFHFFLQGIFPTQGWNLQLLPYLLDCRTIVYLDRKLAIVNLHNKVVRDLDLNSLLSKCEVCFLWKSASLIISLWYVIDNNLILFISFFKMCVFHTFYSHFIFKIWCALKAVPKSKGIVQFSFVEENF